MSLCTYACHLAHAPSRWTLGAHKYRFWAHLLQPDVSHMEWPSALRKVHVLAVFNRLSLCLSMHMFDPVLTVAVNSWPIDRFGGIPTCDTLPVKVAGNGCRDLGLLLVWPRRTWLGVQCVMGLWCWTFAFWVCMFKKSLHSCCLQVYSCTEAAVSVFTHTILKNIRFIKLISSPDSSA